MRHARPETEVTRGRRPFAQRLLAALLFLLAGCGRPSTPSGVTPAPSPPRAPAGPPNIVFIVADDLGYGDLASYGSPKIKTPNLDRLASEGVRFTNFRVPVPICAPSRAALLTGRYPIRTGIPWNPPLRLFDDEVTIAQALKARGYATSMVGKWHLGWESEDMPLFHGFDHYYGIPFEEGASEFLQDNTPIPGPAGLDLVTRSYTEEAVKVIRELKDRPFFLYLAYKAPHTPLFASDGFLGRSAGGLYGDVVEELDWSVGEVVKTLRETGLDRKTLVFFMSDNGPATGKVVKGVPVPELQGGTAGPLSGAKGSPLEGGVRVPAIAWWPGRILGGRVSAEAVSSLDVFPTAVAMAGGQLSTDRAYDGHDLERLLTGEVTHLSGPGIEGGREFLGYFADQAVALTCGRWKYLKPGFWSLEPGLYDIEADPGETTDLRASHPDVAAAQATRLEVLADEVARSVGHRR